MLFLELVSTGSPYRSALLLNKQVSVVAVLGGDRPETGTLIALQEELLYACGFLTWQGGVCRKQ